MRIKLIHILLFAYLVIVSIINKEIEFVSFIILIAAFLLDIFVIKNRIGSNAKNLAYVLIAFAPFPNLLALFLLYLPFAAFGIVFEKTSFIKNYIFGFAVSLLPTILLYTASNYLGLPLNLLMVLLFFYVPAAIALSIALKRKKIFDVFGIDLKESFLFIIILAATVFVGINIVNNDSLFISNGTYMFSKFNLIVENVKDFGGFPIYDPSTSSGESPFLFEAPLVFSHVAFANIVLSFIPVVFFYNLYSFFSLFLASLSLTLLLRSIIKFEKEEWMYIIVIATGALSIGLNFYFVQFLEAFKESFAFPINYLIFALILSRPRQLKEIMIIFFLVILTFILHTPHGVGIVLISSSLVFLILLKSYFSNQIKIVINRVLKNKIKIIVIGFIIVLLPLFYIAPTFVFRDFLEDKEKFDIKKVFTSTPNYYKDFVFDRPVSLSFPDVTRNDDKKFGPFVSIFGLIALILSFVFIKIKRLGSLRLFIGAYLIHFLISSFIVMHPLIGSLEYGYRTAMPYLLILLVASIASLLLIINNKHARWLLAGIFLINLLYVMPLEKSNIQNIHQEVLISGQSFGPEIDFLKKLPNDGRIITYGFFANAVDPGLAALTDKYFSRYHLTEFARSRSIYSKIHGSNSFGQETFVLNKSGVELSNLLRLGGYRYVFVNVCHPVGSFIGQSIYPNHASAIYQNQCSVILFLNNTNYAEKISILEDVDDEIYKTGEGHKYYALSSHFDFGNVPYSKDIIELEHLDTRRISPTEVIINGNFEENEWVVFKEDYFSRWKAFMDGKEIPLMATNHNSILVKTIKGDSIALKYSVLPIERIIGSISFLAALFFMIILFLFLSGKLAKQ